MNLSISNIAWSKEHDLEMYRFLKENGLKGLEIAPTRLFTENPYEQIEAAKVFSETIKNNYGLCISSMQSIWYGKNENIFGSVSERETLIAYTKKAIDFAEAINCRNLVFGCPKNRNIPDPNKRPIAIEFFRIIGEYAFKHQTIIAIEPNPTIYNTNFINTTSEAFEICKEIDSPGIKVNIDFGTIIFNNENFDQVIENIDIVNHIHISEPYLEMIQKRSIHEQLLRLRKANYDKFISIEMKNTDDIEIVKNIIHYVKGVVE